MKRKNRLYFIVLLLVMLIIFSIQNYALVELKLLAWSVKASRALVIFSTLLIGILIGLPRRQKATGVNPWMNGFLGRSSDPRRGIGTSKIKMPRLLSRGVSPFQPQP